MLDFDKIKVLTFDCYGTLIDWESGILSALRPLLSVHRITCSDDELLSLYSEAESKIEAGEYVDYKTVLNLVVQEIGRKLGFTPSEIESESLVNSIGMWMPFPDTVEGLRTLKSKFKLAIVSNVDDDLFAKTAERLSVEFDWIVTAEQVGSYKPSAEVFRTAVDRIGVSSDAIVHVAQSVYHDIVPAKEAGLATVWVNRRKHVGGFGATPPSSGQPDLEVPDLKTLVSIIRGRHIALR